MKIANKAMPTAKQFAYHRRALAEKLVDSVTGQSPFDQTSGLFLAAPRRTGKSTFLRLDFVPALRDRDISPIMVDLWSNKNADPSDLIVNAIKAAIRQSEAAPLKVMRDMGLTKFGAGGLNFDLEKVGVVGGITIADALQYLFDRTGRPVALVIDEAQHALTTAPGLNAMFAIKAARDQLNQNGEGEIRFAGVFTGSNQDKLANLVTGRDRPFFGANVTAFPLLDRGYANAFTDWLNERLAEDNQFRHDDVFAVFDALHRRPEELRRVLKAIALSENKAAAMTCLLADNGAMLRRDYAERFAVAFAALEPLQQAVLARLIDQGNKFSPYSADALASYAAQTSAPVPSIGAVQNALATLRERNIVWQPARGEYALEDSSMAEWYRSRSTALPDDRPPAEKAAALIARSALEASAIDDPAAFVAEEFPDLSPDDQVAITASIEDAQRDQPTAPVSSVTRKEDPRRPARLDRD
jgi:hypothetical protein